MTNALEVKNLSKAFKEFSLENINFVLPEGYIMGLIGPNGSGKTTTIKLILNMLRKDSGEISVFGLDNIEQEKSIKENIGVVFDTAFFAEGWTTGDIEGAIAGFYKNWDKQTYKNLLERFKISGTKKVKELSRGMQMKLMLACAFSHDAKLLILDEPTSGLDPVARNELIDILQDYISSGEKSVLFSTHITNDLERIADYITFIIDGKLHYTGTKDDFLEGFRLVKGGNAEITNELRQKIIGLRQYAQGFEGLMYTKDAQALNKKHDLVVDAVSIDEIIVYTKKGGEYDA